MFLTSLACVAALVAASTPAAAAPANAPITLAQLDALHIRRADPQARRELAQLIDRALAESPRNYDVLWRASRQAFWEGDDPSFPSDLRSRWGKRGMELGARAVQANPAHAAGYYWEAVNLGNYALGLGVFRALSEGLEGRFRDRLGKAEKLDSGFQHGNVYSAWGQFYAKLPWPKYDAKRSEAAFRHALELDPANVRAKEWLAELLVREDRKDEARRLLQEVLATHTVVDPGELPRAHQRATTALSKLGTK